MLRKNILSIFVALLIAFLSLASAEKIQHFSSMSFRGLDKLVHFIMYFIFTSVIFFENRKRIGLFRTYILVALIPLVFGLILELMQSWFTTTRTGSFWDFIFNLLGVMTALFLFSVLKYYAGRKVRN